MPELLDLPELDTADAVLSIDCEPLEALDDPEVVQQLEDAPAETPEAVASINQEPPTSTAAAANTTVATETTATTTIPEERNPSSENSAIEIFLQEKFSLRESIAYLERLVADQSVEVHRLTEQRKQVKDGLKVSTEELSGLKRRLAQMDDQGPWPIHSERPTTPMPAEMQAAPQETTAVQPTDPANETPLSDLGLTPGRRAKLEETEVIPGRNCSTVADLERLIREGRLQQVKGFGEKAIDAVTDALMAWRERHPVPVIREAESAQVSDTVSDRDTPMDDPVSANDPTEVFAEKSLIEIPADLVSESVESEEGDVLILAYTAGAEAAIEDRPVTGNPHPPGTQLWQAWDRGWQECYGG